MEGRTRRGLRHLALAYLGGSHLALHQHWDRLPSSSSMHPPTSSFSRPSLHPPFSPFISLLSRSLPPE